MLAALLQASRNHHQLRNLATRDPRCPQFANLFHEDKSATSSADAGTARTPRREVLLLRTLRVHCRQLEEHNCKKHHREIAPFSLDYNGD